MKYLIIGGTGTLGRALTTELLKDPRSEILCFSRDELKQKDLTSHFRDSRLRTVLGDVRDARALRIAMKGIHTVFHVAAYKHVDIAEVNPEECIATNVFGTINAADAAVEAGVLDFVFCSTDKAVDPINVYGCTKALSERVLLNRNQTQHVTKFSVFRWGNILGSRGSVLHSFSKSLKEEGKVNITSADMTRFWLTIEEAASFMIRSYPTAPTDDVLIPNVKAAPVTRIISTMAKILNVHSYSSYVVGLRPGEKMHEALRSVHSKNPVSSDLSEQYTEKELHDLLLHAMRAEGLCQS